MQRLADPVHVQLQATATAATTDPPSSSSSLTTIAGTNGTSPCVAPDRPHHHPTSHSHSSNHRTHHPHSSSSSTHYNHMSRQSQSTSGQASSSAGTRRGSEASAAGGEAEGSAQSHGGHAHTSGSGRLSNQSTSGPMRSRHNSNAAPSAPPSPGRASASSSSHQRGHSTVMALVDFDASTMGSQPSTSTASPLVYLSFRGGEIIRVIHRDPSGWWDGEVDNRRGWFPSNYVTSDFDQVQSSRRPESQGGSRAGGEAPSSPRSRRFDRSGAPSHTEAKSRHTSIMSQASYVSYQSHTSQPSHSNNSTSSPLSEEYNTLLQPAIAALTAYQRDVRDGPNAGNSITLSARSVLGEVRSILQRTGCMSKGSSLLKNTALNNARSKTLHGLTSFVNSTKSLQAEGNPYSEAAIEMTLTDATALFEHIRKFVAIANDLGIPVGDEPQDGGHDTLQQAYMSRRVRVPSNGHAAGGGATAANFRLKSASTNDLRGASRRQGAGSPPPPLPSGSASTRPSPAAAAAMVMSPSMASSSGQSSPGVGSMRGHPRSNSASRHARSTSYDLLHQMTDSPDFGGISTPELSQSTSAVPSAREGEEGAVYSYGNWHEVHRDVAKAEDALLSVIAGFIGHIHSHHIDSHPSSHAYLIDLTRQTVDSVRELLSIIEGVGRGAGLLGVRPRDIERLKEARNDLFKAASNLVESAEAVANAPFAEGGGDQYDEEKAGLLRHTTHTLRAGSECARVIRKSGEDLDDVASETASTTTAAYSSAGSTRGGYQGIGLGIRGAPGSIQGLQRRATSLTQLHKRFNADGARVTTPGSQRRLELDGDDEEIVADMGSDDEEFVGSRRLPPRHSSGPISHPGQEDKRHSMDLPQSRTTNMGSPSKHGQALPNEIDLTDDMPDSRPTTLKSFSSQSTSLSTPFPHSSSTGELMGASMLPDQPLNGDMAVDPSIEGLKHAAKHFQPPAGPAPARPPPPPDSPALSVDGRNDDADLRFWVVAHDYDPREVAFNPEGVLVGGTLRVLVEKLTPVDGLPDRAFAEAFWYTFRLHSTPLEVLETFIQRFNISPPNPVAGLGEEALAMWAENKQKPVRYRVIICIKTWLDHHWRPASDEAVIDRFEAFLNSDVMQAVPLASRAQDSLRKRIAAANEKDGEEDSKSSLGHNSGKSIDRGRASTGIILSPNPGSTVKTPIINKALMAALSKDPQPNINITDFDTLELARQLTIMESKLFAKVAPEDLLQTGKRTVPELKALSTLSNQITGWVTDVILHEPDTKHRGALLKFFIKLADKCLTLNNFSTLFAVLAGLNSSTVDRLKNTWAVLNPKYRALMQKLRGVMEHTKNHSAYRARLRDVTPPCLPFLGLILSDITFTQDGNANHRPSTISPDIALINQDKFAKLGRIAADFKRYQAPFEFKELEPVQRYLTRALAERGSGSLDALYRKSLLLEPRQGSEARLSSAVDRPGWLGGRLQGPPTWG